MQSVFISHSSTDADFARRLGTDLRAAGYGARSFIDIVRPGEKLSRTELDSRLNGAITVDTFFVPVLTQTAVGSPWVERELAAAIEAESKKDQIKVVPVLSEPCILPLRLGLRSPADFTASYEAGLRDLLSMLSPPRAPNVAVGLDLTPESAQSSLTNAIQELGRTPGALHDLSPRDFEELIAKTFTDQGLNIEVSHTSRDGGIDVFLLGGSDRLREPILLQCKRYKPNRQLSVEIVRTLVASALVHDVGHASMVTTAECFDYFSDDTWWRQSWKKLWSTRCTIDLDRSYWTKFLLWMASSAGLNRQLEARLVEARERYSVLVDKRFATGFDAKESSEIAQLEFLLDAADAPFYEPIKSRLKAIRDSLGAEKDSDASGDSE
jgi:hypothetical protein